MDEPIEIDPDEDEDVRTFVDDLAWRPDGSLLAIAVGDYWGREDEDENFQVLILNVYTRRVVFTAAHRGAPQLAWDPTGNDLLIASGNGLIERYNVATNVLQTTTAERSWSEFYRLDGMSINSDGTRVATISGRLEGPQAFVIYDAHSLQPLVSSDLEFTYAARNKLTLVGYSPDGGMLATTGWDGNVRLWDIKTLAPLTTLITSPNQRLYHGAWSKDGLLAVRDAIWDVKAEKIVSPTPGFGAYRWHPDGRQIAWGGQFWDTVTGQPTVVIPFDRSIIQSVEVTPNARAISAAGVVAQGIEADGRVRFDPNGNLFDILPSLVTIPALPPPTLADIG